MRAGYKVKEIIENEFDSRVAMMVVSYILDKGWSYTSSITEEEILTLEGNGLMTAEFIQALVRTSAKICKETSQIDDFLPYIINQLYVPNAPMKDIELYKDDVSDECWETLLEQFNLDINDEVDLENIEVIELNANLVGWLSKE